MERCARTGIVALCALLAACGPSFDFTETNGTWGYGPFHSIDLGHH